MINIGVLVSGSGTNLQSIIDACAAGEIDGRVAVVISNKADAYALSRAEKAGIPTRVVLQNDFPDRQAFDRELLRILAEEFAVDLVALAGFMRLLSNDFVKGFHGRLMNIHPALLPSFPGLHVRQQAIDYGVRFSGCTVHFVDEGTDTGPIIIQAVVPVYPEDTADELADRILVQEHRIYPRAIEMFARNQLTIEGRRVIIRDPDRDDTASLINPPLG